MLQKTLVNKNLYYLIHIKNNNIILIFECYNQYFKSLALISGPETISFFPPVRFDNNLASSLPKGISTIKVIKVAKIVVNTKSPTK